MTGVSQTHPRPSIAPASTGGFEATCACGWSQQERWRKAIELAVLVHVEKSLGVRRRRFFNEP